MNRRTLFIDRDGTLIEEPSDFQVDRIDKLRLVPGVMHALKRLQEAGYRLVMVSNQDGLGSDNYPQSAFDEVQDFVEQLFASQGIVFDDVRICPHVDRDGCECRKPRVGLLLDYLRDGFDYERSAVIGDRDTDIELAKRLGVRGFKLRGFEGEGLRWNDVADELLTQPRRATVERNTRETCIRAEVNLDNDSVQTISTGLGFFDHMLESFARHGGFSLRLECSGDLHVDEHHTVEDCALVLGDALNRALGERRGIGRFGFSLPMDDASASALIDLGGRPYFLFDGQLPRAEIGGISTEMLPHFFRSLAETLRMNLHLSVTGDNTHHMIEACFKTTARALRQAFAKDGNTIPSTKGSL